ncbi:MAG: zinc dependent phospholipase C family protein [Bacteroidota bacterium]
MKKIKKIIPLIVLLTFLFAFTSDLFSWGFYSHKKVNRQAVFCLPPQMVGFYKQHIEYIIEHSVDPDKRTFADPKEAPRHYIDIDHYGKDAFTIMPHRWKDAVAKFTEDTLNEYGINPWWINTMYYRLVLAFKAKDVDLILYTSANLGHYIADACVPLHNTQFYDGRVLREKGIHSFWETGVPTLLAEDYDFFTGRAAYIADPAEQAWELTEQSQNEIDSVLSAYSWMLDNYPSDKIYSFVSVGAATKKAFSKEFAIAYSQRLNNMIERKMRLSLFMVASYWYTAWVDAGQPDLKIIESKAVSDSLKKKDAETEYLWKHGHAKGRANPDD